MTKVIAVLATLDTKGAEAQYLREQLEALGSRALILDLGVLGEPGTQPDIDRSQVAAAGGTSLVELQASPNREVAQPVMVAGAAKLLHEQVEADQDHGVIGLGG